MPCRLTGECCWTPEGRCEFLTPGLLCSLRVELGSWGRVHADSRWTDSPIGRYFADRFPGFGCGDYPQNIPEVMSSADAGKCCYG